MYCCDCDSHDHKKIDSYNLKKTKKQLKNNKKEMYLNNIKKYELIDIE